MSIELDIEIGDIVLTGKFKNKRTTVKSIGKDELGQPTINGKPLLKLRIEKLLPKEKQSKETRGQMKEFSSKRFKELAGLITESKYAIGPANNSSRWFKGEMQQVAAERVADAVRELLESLEDAFEDGVLGRSDADSLKKYLSQTTIQIDMIDNMIDAVAEEQGF